MSDTSWRPDPEELCAQAGFLRALTVRLVRGVLLRGRVLDAEGAPVAGAKVSANRDDGAFLLATTDERGEFRAATLPHRRHRVFARAEDGAGRRRQGFREDVRPEDPEFEIRLE